MKKLIALVGALLVIAGALAVAFTPDILSLLIISLMCLILLLGFIAGMVPLMLYADGLRTARGNIVHLSEISTDTPWVALQQLEYFFHQKTLDGLFALYRSKINEQQKEDQVPSDIEDVINEEALALRSWQNVVNQIPGTMTALGLLGTFLGLIIGISSISRSSFSSCSTGTITPAREGSASSKSISCAEILFKISIRNVDLKPMLMGLPVYWQVSVSSAEVEKSMSCAEIWI